MTVYGIRDFYNSAVKNQFMRDFNFRLMQINTSALQINATDELVYAIANKLPARNITNHTQPFMGLDLNVAGSVKYPGSDSYSISFFMDANGAMRQKLERASRYIFNDTYSTGDYRVPSTESSMILATVDNKLEIITKYTLVGAQFRTVGEVQFDYLGGSGQLAKCDCTLAFQWYEVSDSSDKVSGAQ